MKVTITDGNGTKTLTRNVHYGMKRVLGLAERRGYGWAIKPDSRQKHPKGVKPMTHIILAMTEAPQAGAQVVVTYQSSF